MNAQIMLAVLACVFSFMIGFMLCVQLMSRVLKQGVRDTLILLLAATKGAEKDDDD